MDLKKVDFQEKWTFLKLNSETTQVDPMKWHLMTWSEAKCSQNEGIWIMLRYV